MTDPRQAGVRPSRIEWITEATTGQVPADPSWNLFSDAVMARWDTEPDANTTRQQPSGDVKPSGYFNGAETWEFSMEYDLQEWVDTGAINDFLDVSSDNTVNNTHSVVEREELTSGGVDSSGIRNYTVAKGGYPSNTTIPFETEDGTPITVTLEYQAEKIRQYSIDQPADDTTLDVSSSDSSDTSQTLTLEDEGASTTEDVDLNGTTTETTTASFSDIDAAELDAETVGDVTIQDDSSNTLLTIYGQDSYPAGEGDLGVPALGSGSHASALNSSYVIFNNDVLTTSNSGAISEEITSGELTVDLGLDDNTQTETARRNIHMTQWTATFTATVAGPDVSPEGWVDYLTENTFDQEWQADEGTVTLNTCTMMSPGSYSPEPEQGKLLMDQEFEAQDITIS